jgi:probable rRNA maturation factor
MSAEDADGAVSLAMVDEAEMTELNERFRDCAGPTDVLSFWQDDDEGTWPDPTGQQARDWGEVVVCPSVVQRYAAQQGGDPDTQLGWAVMHGVLHLLGHDHERDGGEMRRREQALLLELAPEVRAVSRALKR